MKFKIDFSLIILLVIAFFLKNSFLMVSYFIALVFHEFGHILVAKHKGYAVSEVRCSIFGMKMTLSASIHPNDEFLIALAGPFVNLFLCIICTSLWWLLPESYYFLNNFFWSNLTLCFFNLLPISPLDGSLMAKSFFKHRLKNKTYVVLKKIFQIMCCLVFIGLFIFSCFNDANLFFLIVAIFFLFEIFLKNKSNLFAIGTNHVISKEKRVYQANLFYVSCDCTLLELYKKTNERKYVLFLCTIKGKQHFFSEEILQKWLSVYPFDATLDMIFS